MKKIKQPKKIEPHWSEMVELWFKFCRDNFGDDPTFDGSSPRNLKSIIKSLRERAEHSGYEWTIGTARYRFTRFLEFAIKDNWLRNNWMLFNIDRQKDKIFFQIRKSTNQTPVDPFE